MLELYSRRRGSAPRLLVGHAPSRNDRLVPLLATAAAAAPTSLFMWQVKSDHATVSLVGSIHVGQPDFFPLAARYEDAFAAARSWPSRWT